MMGNNMGPPPNALGAKEPETKNKIWVQKQKGQTRMVPDGPLDAIRKED